MVTSAMLCLLVFKLTNSLKQGILRHAQFWRSFFVSVIMWSLVLIILSLVSVSRVFIATHFPHQVFLGTVIGLIVAYVVKNHNSLLIWVSSSAIYSASFSLSLIVGTLFTYFTLSLLVYDPSTSVSKAQKWCIRSSYVHLDTTPFYALVRDAGVTIGLGISLSMFTSAERGKVNWRSLSSAQMLLLSGSLKVILSILLLQLLEVISLPKSNPLLFYVAGYIRCSLIPVIVILIVPSIVILNFDAISSSQIR